MRKKRMSQAAGSARDGMWRALHRANSRSMPASLRPWMLLDSSMTDRLSATVGRTVQVHLLRQESDFLHADERTLFGARRRKGVVREACLHSGGHMLLAARTVFVSARLRRSTGLAALGCRPLGELLFVGGQPAKWRLREYALLSPASPLFALLQSCAGPSLPHCWARRSMFLLDGEPMLVTEMFLPALFDGPQLAAPAAKLDRGKCAASDSGKPSEAQIAATQFGEACVPA